MYLCRMNSNKPKKYEQDSLEHTVAAEPAASYGYAQNMPLQGLLEYLYATLSPNNMEWLGEHLIEHAQSGEHPYTMDEINDMLDEAERNFEAGLGIPSNDVFRELEEEFEKEKLQFASI